MGNGWATVYVERKFVDADGQCGLGDGLEIQVTLICDCRSGDEITEPVIDLMEVSFGRIIEANGTSVYSRLGCNAIALEAGQWNTLYEFVKREASKQWIAISAEALAADPVEFFRDEEDYTDVF
jgi:hypothetical protein